MTAVLPLGGADDCPVCGAVHGQLDEFWACPTHGHRLQSWGRDGDYERFKCPAFRCAYTRSAPPKPRTPSKGDPMTAIESRPSVAVDKMWARSKHIAAVLPDHIDVKSFIGTAAAALYADPNLMKCAETAPDTLMVALLRCASLGHRPGTEEFYLTPRGLKGGKRGPEVVGIEGYRGIVERMYRSGAVAKVVVREVCAKDQFIFLEGSDDKPVHSFGQGGTSGGSGADFFGEHGSIDRGEMVGVYAYAILTNGAVSRVALLSRDDVLAARDSGGYTPSDPHSPWNRLDGGKDRPEFKGRSMWWKTAARRLEPWVPTSAEYRREQLRATAQASAAFMPPSVPAPAVAENGHQAVAQPQAPAIEGGEGVTVQDGIHEEFGRLGLEDPEERAVYVHKLAGRDFGVKLSDLELAVVYDALMNCQTVADLRALAERQEAS